MCHEYKLDVTERNNSHFSQCGHPIIFSSSEGVEQHVG